ncbi:MAG: hypothetical protein OXI67_01695 [Candidatus Poribacteria bacterium]|nr:hypothetical protein [Candidatus Poribacteria bacterium]
MSCDGTHTNSPDGWKETKVGCVYKDYPQLLSGGTPSARTSSIRYVAGREDAAQFGPQLFALATEPLLFDGDITAVVACIRGFAAQQSEVLDILEREARYFEKHTERMPYKVFREKWGVGQILE